VSELTRYWITFEYPSVEGDGVVVGLLQPIGFGVTAFDLEDALAIIRSEFFEEWFGRFDTYYGLDDMPPLREVVENVDVSLLGDPVRSNMHPPNWRGMWYPPPKPLN